MPKDGGYERPNFTVDLIIVRFQKELELLLIRRGKEPFKDQWAFPGGFVNPNEPHAEAAVRELEEETGIKCSQLDFFGLYDTPGADPRGWRISSVHSAVVPRNTEALAGDDAESVQWFTFNAIPPLAFDHALILRDFMERGELSLGRLFDENPRSQD
jgi:8-oxo-dGTP diphosphatase